MTSISSLLPLPALPRLLALLNAGDRDERGRTLGELSLHSVHSCRASSSRGAHSSSGGGAPSYSSYPSVPSVCGRGRGAGGAPAPSAGAPVDTSGCATAVLADQMELFCGSSSSAASPNPACCEAVVGSARRGAGGVPCFCHVPLLSSSFDVDRISSLYAACVTASDPGANPHLAVYMCPSNRV